MCSVFKGVPLCASNGVVRYGRENDGPARRQGRNATGRSVAWGQMYSAGQHSREKVCVRQRIALRRFGTVLLTSIDTSRPPGYDAMAARRKWHECAVRARARRRSFAHDRSRHASGPARRERPREARGVRPGGRGRAHAPTPSAATRRPLSAVLARLARSRGDAAASCAAAGVLACGTGAPAVGGQREARPGASRPVQ
jgi:hypothetical protein